MANQLPDELANAQKRFERLQQAKAELEQEAQAQVKAALDGYTPGKRGPHGKAEQTSQPSKDRRQREKDKKQRLRARKNAVSPSRQYNFVDPDSRVMKDSGERGFVQAYNAQIAVDSKAQIIVAAELTQQPIDRQELLPMVKTLRKTLQAVPTTITADAGYWDTTSLQDPAMSGIEMLVAPDSKPHIPGKPLPPCAPRRQEAFDMRKVLATEDGKAAVCTSTDNGGTGIRPDQRSTWYPQVPLTRPVERDIRVEIYLCHAQSSQTVPPSSGSGSCLTPRTQLPRTHITSTAHSLSIRCC